MYKCRMLIGETEERKEELMGILYTFHFPLNLKLHWLIYLVVWQKPAQYCKGIILQLKRRKKMQKAKNCTKISINFLKKEKQQKQI